MIRSSLGIIGAVFLLHSAFAHHGIANFNHNKEVSVTGTITKLSFVNPHSWLYFDAVDDNGNVVNWRCEMRSATVLRRSGWSKDMFEIGSRIRITGSPDRNDPAACYLGTITFANGLSLDRYDQYNKDVLQAAEKRPLRLPNGDPYIGGDWAAEQRVLTDPRGMSGAFLPISVAQKLQPGEVPEGEHAFPATRGTRESLQEGPVTSPGNFPPPVAVTEAGMKAATEHDGTNVMQRLLSCQPTNILYDWTFDFHTNRIKQDEEKITMQYGFMDIERTIHMDMAEHPAGIQPTFAGHSIGRWEDDVLVVDTIGFIPARLSRVSDVIYSDQFHVVERFELDTEKQTLTRSYVANDPLYFKEAYSGSDIVHIADLSYEDYGCDDQTLRQEAPATGSQKTRATPEQDESKPWWRFWE